MTAWTLILRNLRHFRRTHLGVVLGVACASTVLVGALAVGDSVRVSLREQALARIGGVQAALVANERFFTASLADRTASALPGSKSAPVLRLRGVASTSGGRARAGIVEVHGVDERFFALGPQALTIAPPQAGQAHLNERLAHQLGVRAGDEVLVRVEKPGLLPRDMVMSTIEDISIALRVVVGAVLGEDEFGNFSLHANQVPPHNLFVPLAWLQQQLELPHRANLLLLQGDAEPGDLVTEANRSLARNWTLADAELRVGVNKDRGFFELVSDRVFIETAVIETANEIEPGLLGILTYFVNGLRHGARSTPYSMVSAMGALSPKPAPMIPEHAAPLRILSRGAGMRDIVLNDWLAADLQAKVGDTIELDYFVMAEGLRLETASRAFRVHSVTPLDEKTAGRDLTPEFPGLEDSENCRDWEPGIPIELDRIRDADEKYWDDHKTTPKAFIHLRTGQPMWGNRFGTLTAIRGPAARADHVKRELPRKLDPARLGLFFRDVRSSALAAGAPATDFGGLFLGLSFFLIIAALLLTALLFVFGVEQRAREIGTLLAVGFRPKSVRRLFLGEAALLALIGSAVGAGLAAVYARLVMHGLGTVWQDAVGETTLSFHARIPVLAGGVLIALLVSLVAMALALRRAFDSPIFELLTSRSGIPRTHPLRVPGRARVSLLLSIACLVAALAFVVSAGNGSAQAAGAFFGAGSLLLLGGLFACRHLLARCAHPRSSGVPSVSALGLRNAGRRPGRSLATIALLACGTFLVVAVQAYRLEPPADWSKRSSGTGGFALFGRSTLPVLRDLGTSQGRAAFGLDQEALAGISIAALRVQEGDDASCLNLNRPQNPRLLGVQPRALAEREAFTFASTDPPTGGDSTKNPWLLLDAEYGEGVVPAIGDQASVLWILHKSVGDHLDYRDDRGRRFRVRIVGTVTNSILQGNLLISEKHFKQRFPSTSGYRMFLVDAPASRVDAVTSTMTRALEDIGLELTSTTDRLRAFNGVQNTYLLIFQALGGLGLLLGSVGLGMVVLRNALERRSELAITTAVGFPRRLTNKLLWSEHALLLACGLLTGVLAALVAVVPGLQTRDSPFSATLLLLTLAVAANGALWVWFASRVATSGPLLQAIHDD